MPLTHSASALHGMAIRAMALGGNFVSAWCTNSPIFGIFPVVSVGLSGTCCTVTIAICTSSPAACNGAVNAFNPANRCRWSAHDPAEWSSTHRISTLVKGLGATVTSVAGAASTTADTAGWLQPNTPSRNMMLR